MTVVCVLRGGKMKVLVIGSKQWNSYPEIMRNLTVTIEDINYFYPDEKTITFIHTGSRGAENMVTEYVGKVEKFMKNKGFSIKEQLVRLPKGEFDLNARINRDYDMINSGISIALIFTDGTCKRSEACAKILNELEIPTRIIKE
jgi:hypothetical protein